MYGIKHILIPITINYGIVITKAVQKALIQIVEIADLITIDAAHDLVVYIVIFNLWICQAIQKR